MFWNRLPEDPGREKYWICVVNPGRHTSTLAPEQGLHQGDQVGAALPLMKNCLLALLARLSEIDCLLAIIANAGLIIRITKFQIHSFLTVSVIVHSYATIAGSELIIKRVAKECIIKRVAIECIK